MVVAGVEERAVSPVEAELAWRGAGKEESGAVCVPSSDQKHREPCPKAQAAAGTGERGHLLVDCCLLVGAAQPTQPSAGREASSGGLIWVCTFWESWAVSLLYS